MASDSPRLGDSRTPIHARQWKSDKPLTVWRCTCGTMEVGTPTDPCPTRPRDHQNWRLRRHDWTPVTQAEADAFFALLEG